MSGPLAELEANIAGHAGVLVAFSGGVDSSVVAAVAARVQPERAIAITAVSPALASGELDGARRVAAAVGIEHEVIRTDELARPGYRRNGRDRCYHCKTELYDALTETARERGLGTVLSGANADDLGDWRPGLRAAAEHSVRHPLVECGVDKAGVRAIARSLRVPSAEKPPSPCLASRIPYGTPVEAPVLAQIDRAERAVRALGFEQLRVRHHGPLGRLELPGPDLVRALAPGVEARLLAAIRAAGYARASLDRRPFRSGSLNRATR